MNKALKLKQTKANKQKFWSPLLDLLKITTPVTRGELQDAVGFSDRAVRKEISNILVSRKLSFLLTCSLQ